MAFIIDENAFELLHNYLEALKRKFNNEAEREEIMNDIEARIAEMLTQKLADRKEVVSINEVQAIMDVLGKPEDIAGEDAEPASTRDSTTTETVHTGGVDPTVPGRKRLFRDADDAMVAGVIAGMCHYFGIKNPNWIRIAALILVAPTGGAILLLYLLLMIIVPEAHTAAEKLEMKGEPININTIEKEIKDAAMRTGESVNRLIGRDSLFEKLLRLFVSVTKVVAKIIIGFIIVIALIVITALILGLFGVAVAGTAFLATVPHLLVENPATRTIFNIGLVLFVVTPLIGLIYAALRALLGKDRGRAPWLKWTLLTGWWIGLFMIAYSAIQTLTLFQTSGTKHEQMALMQPANGGVLVQLCDSTGKKLLVDSDEDDFNFHIGFNGIYLNGQNIDETERITVDEPSLQILPSQNDSFYVEKIMTSQGKSKGDALKNLSYINYNFSQTDTVVNLPATVTIDKAGKYRAQRLNIRIYIPEGKRVSFADNIDHWAATVKGDRNYNDTYFSNTTWTVEKGKIKCLVGENHFNANPDDYAEEKQSSGDKHGKSSKEQDSEENQDSKDQDF